MVSPCRPLIVFLISALLCAGSCVASDSSKIHIEIGQIYNFHPHDLSTEQINAKSKLLDEFWNKAKADSPTYIAALRQELADFSNPQFFFYDGGKLLLSLSNTPQDKRIVMTAFLHCDLKDLQLLDYFLTVHSFAADGLDTTDLAFRVLENPKFQVFIPQHVLTLGQDYCLVYLLLPTDQQFWLQRSIARMSAEKDMTARKSLALLLWYAQTDSADRALRTAAAEPNSAEFKSYVDELIKRKSGVVAHGQAIFKSESALRKERMEIMKRVSDEALYDLDSVTEQLMAKR